MIKINSKGLARGKRPVLSSSILSIVVLILVGCTSPKSELPRVTQLPNWFPPVTITILPNPHQPGWRVADEHTFTFEYPPFLKKQNVHGYDSHVGEYKSDQMQVEFDEVTGLGLTAADMQRRHDRLAAKFARSPHPDGSTFVCNLNCRYAEITVSEHEVMINSPKPPNAENRRGNYGESLSLWIHFENTVDLETALRIANSLEFKIDR